MAYRISVDIGGTFTDFCVFDNNTSELISQKVLSTPEKPGYEIINGISELKKNKNILSEEIEWFSHGTTVGINTVIQRTGSKLALFVTENFEDVLEVARLKVPDPYNIFSSRPKPLVPRENVFGINQRTLKDGSSSIKLDEKSVLSALNKAINLGVETIVVCLLHSYKNPNDEKKIKDIINSVDKKLTVTLSSDVWPVIREYERTVTTTVAGYVQKKVALYLTAFQNSLKEVGIKSVPLIGKSNGGVMTAELAKSDPISMLLSGTAAGAIGAADIAKKININSLLSFDVGGTSADLSVIQDGIIPYSSGEMVGDFPIYVPTVSVTSIGEGGGSIAWVDEFGVLKVGPKSAGSSPGPACYGNGGINATITDAFAILGLLGHGDLGYGKVNLDIKSAQKALEPISKSLGVNQYKVAQSIIDIAISGMFLETTKLLSRYGADPRKFSLLAFGGAGPMMGCFLAEELGIKEIIIPITPGVLSAYGGLIADIRNDFIRTVIIDVNKEGIKSLFEIISSLENEANNWLRNEQNFSGESELIWSADMRYRGQSFEIETLLTKDDLIKVNIEEISNKFHKAHHKAYDHSDENTEIQIVNLRLVVSGKVSKPKIAFHDEKYEKISGTRIVDVIIKGNSYKASLFNREQLKAGQSFNGPAIISQSDTTTFILPDYNVKIDKFLNLIIQKGY